MTTNITHIVEYDYWYRTRFGDWDFQSNFLYCFSEEEANVVAERFRSHKDVKKNTVVVKKLDTPFVAGPEYND